MSTGPSLLASLVSDSPGSAVFGGEVVVGIAATAVRARFVERLNPVGPFASDASEVFIDQCVRMDGPEANADNDNVGSFDAQCLQAYQAAGCPGGKQDATR